MATALHQPEMASPTVFIVDDDDAVRDSLKLLLETYGMSVEDYGSTGDFARHYRPRDCECLILDQHLPGVTGLDFLASAAAAIRTLPVILITGGSDGAMRDRAARLGVSAFLEKPIRDGVLLAAVRQAIASSEGCERASVRRLDG
jgi:FixJ family two-component response regulator